MKIKALAYILLFAIALTSCNKTPKPKGPINGNKPSKELKVKKYDFDNPPEFRKDGELQFIGNFQHRHRAGDKRGRTRTRANVPQGNG